MIISLMGYMGSGKSFTGLALSKLLNYPFIDLDLEIEKIEKRSIKEIFNLKGEEYFRRVETIVLNDILSSFKDNLVLSLGGGTPCFNNNMDMIKQKTISIFLNTHSSIIQERLLRDTDRPLIQNKKDLHEYINANISLREEFYNQADIITDNNSDIESLLLTIRKFNQN